jgi:predicted HicB family RNase H-like nuclease
MAMGFRIDNEFENLAVSHSIRFPEQFHEELATLAERKHISFNNLVLQCCRYALDHLETEEDPSS